jgi:nucleotidyltransferase/DNA polymerase involved in DNA repair
MADAKDRAQEIGQLVGRHACDDPPYTKEDCARCSVETAVRAAMEEARREEREACAKIAESAYPCSCDEAYTTRKLTAPDCFHCVPLAEAAEQIRARGEGKP